MNKKLLVLLYIFIVSSNAFTQLFPSYININSNNIYPYFLSSESNDEVVSDTTRVASSGVTFDNQRFLLSTLRSRGIPNEMLVTYIDNLVDLMPDWNNKLNFIATVSRNEYAVYRIYDDNGLETFVLLIKDQLNNTFDVYPLDGGYKNNIYDYRSHSINGGIEDFLTTVAGDWQIQEVRIGDVDGDGIVDAFLAEGDPIYQNIDGNLEIVGYYGS